MCSVLFYALFCSVIFCYVMFCCSVFLCSVLFCYVLFCSLLIFFFSQSQKFYLNKKFRKKKIIIIIITTKKRSYNISIKCFLPIFPSLLDILFIYFRVWLVGWFVYQEIKQEQQDRVKGE